VKFNTKIRYGMRAMLELAMADNEEGLFQKDIARNQEISLKYLDHIIAALKTSGLIANVSGRKSGYRLTRPAGEITILEIYEAFEPKLEVNECVNDHYDCKRRKICAVQHFWQGLNDQVSGYLKSTTLGDLAGDQMVLNQSLVEAGTSEKT